MKIEVQTQLKFVVHSSNVLHGYFRDKVTLYNAEDATFTIYVWAVKNGGQQVGQVGQLVEIKSKISN